MTTAVTWRRSTTPAGAHVGCSVDDGSGSPGRVVTWTLALAAAALSMVGTVNGPGLTSDSIDYLMMARQMIDGAPLTGFHGVELTVFPPGYPALLALAELVGIGAEQGVRLIDAGSWAIVVVCVGAALRPRVASRAVGLIGLASLAVSPALFTVARMAWSEMPFIATVTLFLTVADRCRQRARLRTSDLIALVVLAWSAYLLRYAGVVLVPVGAVVLWRLRWRRRAVGFVVAAAIVPILWSLRNLSIDGSVMGVRNPSTYSLPGVLGHLVEVVGTWMAPTRVGGLVAMLAVLLIMLAVVADERSPVESGRAEMDRTSSLLSGLSGASGASVRAWWDDLAVWWISTAGLLAVTLWSQLSTQIDRLDGRLLSPLVPGVAIISITALDRILAPRRSHATLRRVALGAFTVWVLAGAVAVLGVIGGDLDRGGSNLAQRFEGSPLAAVAARLPAGTTVYSNQSAGLAWSAGSDRVIDPPARSDYGWSSADPTGEEFASAVACSGGPVVVVWFDRSLPQFLDPSEYPRSVQLRRVISVEDGAVYRVEAAQPC